MVEQVVVVTQEEAARQEDFRSQGLMALIGLIGGFIAAYWAIDQWVFGGRPWRGAAFGVLPWKVLPFVGALASAVLFGLLHKLLWALLGLAVCAGLVVGLWRVMG